jgi:uncharacterized phage-associated protein
MVDDIVTRLRDLAMEEESPWANIYDNVMRQAADEIERLRKELETAQTIIRRGVPEQLQDEMSRLLHELCQLKLEKLVKYAAIQDLKAAADE